MGAVLDQRYEIVPVHELRNHPNNPRRGDLEAIEASIAANGFWGAVVAQRSTGFVLAGNHRLRAAQAKGITELPVVWVDVDDQRARRILLADNRTADLAVNDQGALLAMLEELSITDDVLAGTGFDLDDLEDLRVHVGAVPTSDAAGTDAHYAEDEDDEAARMANRGITPSIHAAGLRELVLVFPAAEHAAVLDLIGRLRPALGEQATTSDVVGAALRLAIDHIAQFGQFQAGTAA